METSNIHESKASNRRKVALVTGSATGIGANIALDLVMAGYRVVVTGRDIAKLDQVVKRCNHNSSSANFNELAIAFLADLHDMTQVDKLIAFIRDKFTKLDVLINNACWRGERSDILNADILVDMQKVMHINVFIPLYLIHKCILYGNTSTDEAVIVNISSTASQAVVPLHLYSISKACLSELTRQIATLTGENKKFCAISCVTISPGPVLTEERPHHKDMSKLTLLKRVGDTQEISNMVMFVLSNVHLFNGREINVDGGWSAREIK